MKKFTALIILAILLCAGQGWATNYYVTQAQQGDGDVS